MNAMTWSVASLDDARSPASAVKKEPRTGANVEEEPAICRAKQDQRHRCFSVMQDGLGEDEVETFVIVRVELELCLRLPLCSHLSHDLISFDNINGLGNCR